NLACRRQRWRWLCYHRVLQSQVHAPVLLLWWFHQHFQTECYRVVLVPAKLRSFVSCPYAHLDNLETINVSCPAITGKVLYFTSSARRCSVASCTYVVALPRSPATCSSLSSRRTLAGTPATSELGGISMPSDTMELAATNEPAPTVAPLSTVAFIPISAPSPTVAPWTMAAWPTETSLPIVHGKPSSACRTTLSCRFERAPTEIAAESPRADTP